MKRKQTLRWLASIVVVTLLLAGGYAYYRFNEAMRSDYETIRVTQMVEDYVRTHGGDWPKSWDDLSGTETAKRLSFADSSYWQRYTTVDFSVRSEELLANPGMIYRAVLPADRVYHVYPHARMDLDRVMAAIREAKKPPANTSR
jgi:hypothetical protein